MTWSLATATCVAPWATSSSVEATTPAAAAVGPHVGEPRTESTSAADDGIEERLAGDDRDDRAEGEERAERQLGPPVGPTEQHQHDAGQRAGEEAEQQADGNQPEIEPAERHPQQRRQADVAVAES